MKKLGILALIVAVTVVVTALAADASLRYYDTDRLDEGRSQTTTLLFGKNQKYMVVTAASHGSIDFDITIIGPDGEEVTKSDSTDENTDWVRFTAPEEGNYKVKVTAYKGSGWYELIVLNTEGY